MSLDLDSSQQARRRPGARVRAGALPQPAERLDPSGPVRPYEFEVAVERLCLDSTSFRNIRERCGRRPRGDGGAHPRDRRPRAARCTTRTPTRAASCSAPSRPSASASPTRRESATRVVTLALADADAAAARRGHRPRPATRPGRGRGHRLRLRARAPGGRCPTTSRSTTALEIYDVYAAGSHTRDLAPRGGTVCVLGAGHAGKLALAAARDAMEGGTLVAVDVDAEAVERVARARPLRRRRRRRPARPARARSTRCAPPASPPADLTVVVVNATGCEPTAILLTADGGTVLFFSMATSFSDRGADRRRAWRRRRGCWSAAAIAPDGGALRARPRARLRPAARALRPARRRRERERGHRVQMRWRDLDGLGHVNHTVVLTYLEEGRDAFLERAASRATSTSSGAARSASTTRSTPSSTTVTVQCCGPRARPLERRRRSERIVDARRRGRRRGRVRPRPLGPAAARASRPITDEERASLTRSGGGVPDDAPGTATRSSSPCAITGADVFRENNPNIPYTTEEIADSTIERPRAGATVAHLHVREDDGTPSGRPELFVDVDRPDPRRLRRS